jgi:hypothetical protein
MLARPHVHHMMTSTTMKLKEIMTLIVCEILLWQMLLTQWQ